MDNNVMVHKENHQFPCFFWATFTESFFWPLKTVYSNHVTTAQLVSLLGQEDSRANAELSFVYLSVSSEGVIPARKRSFLDAQESHAQIQRS